MNQSGSIDELVAAMAEAQKDFGPVLKKNANPAYRGSKYADMASVVEATQESLAKHGLVIIQFPVTEVAAQQAGVSTVIAHKSGQWMESSYMLPALMQGNRFDAQSCGSAFTYARRYAYLAACGVAPEDDDGNAAAGVGSKEAAKEVAVAKLKEHANGDESITISMIETAEGTRFVLAGGGVPIIRAALTGQEKAILDWIQTSTQSSIGGAFLNEFMNLCSKHGVKCLGGDVSIPKAELPTLSDTLTKSIEQVNASKDPIITKCVERTGKKGKYLSIEWNGIGMNIFDAKTFPTFFDCAENHIPVFLETSQDGKYVNFKRMVRLNGIDLTDEHRQAMPNGQHAQELMY